MKRININKPPEDTPEKTGMFKRVVSSSLCKTFACGTIALGLANVHFFLNNVLMCAETHSACSLPSDCV